MSRVFQLPRQVPIVDGVVSPGAEANFYLTGTTTRTDTYSDSSLSTPHANPVVADASGVFATIYLDPDVVYRLVLNDSTGSLIYDEDPIQDALTAASLGLVLFPRTSNETTAGETPTNYNYIDGDTHPGDIRRFGAALDNSTDDAAAIQSAADSVGQVFIPPVGTCRVASAVTFSAPVHLFGTAGSTIRPDLGTSGGKLFAFETSDVLVENLTIDGTGSTGTLAANMYVLFGGDGTTKYYRHTYRNVHIDDCFLSDGNSQSSNLLVTHALYVDNVDQVAIRDNDFDTLSGSGVFTRDITGLVIDNNRFVDCQWYNCTLDSDVKQFAITNNYFDCQLATGVYYGGMVNLMSLHTAGRNQDGIVDNNYFTGNVSYGVVIRCLSITGLEVSNNVIENWDFGTWALSDDLSAIRVDTRGVSTAAQNGPCHDVTIRNNRMSNPDTIENHRGIYCGNQFQSSRTPATNIRVYDNEITSTSTLLYFSEGIIFHGFVGGFDGVQVYGNDVTVYGQTSPTVGGALGFVGSSANGAVDKVYFGRNNLVGLGTPSGSQHVGVSVGAYATNVFNTDPNYIDNFFYGVRTLTNAGPTLDKLDDQIWGTNSTDSLFGVNLSRFGKTLTGSDTWDPGSINTGASETFQITGVTGAVLGDRVEFSFSLDIQDMHLEGAVAASGTIEATLQNNSGSARDLGSGTLYYEVFRRGTG